MRQLNMPILVAVSTTGFVCRGFLITKPVKQLLSVEITLLLKAAFEKDNK